MEWFTTTGSSCINYYLRRARKASKKYQSYCRAFPNTPPLGAGSGFISAHPRYFGLRRHQT